MHKLYKSETSKRLNEELIDLVPKVMIFPTGNIKNRDWTVVATEGRMKP